MSLRKLVVSLALSCAAVAPAIGGCGGSVNVGETHVGKEELFKTGNFTYDEFFEDVNGLQGSSKKAVDDEKAARVALGLALGVGEDVDGSHSRAPEGQSRGACPEQEPRALRVRRARRPSQAGGGQTDHGHDERRQGACGSQGSRRSWLRRIEQTAKAEGQVWEKYGPMPDKAKHLTERGDTLQGNVATEFESASKDKREEVYRELKAAKTIVAEIGDRCDKVVGNSTKFFKQGNDVLTAAANAEIKAAGQRTEGQAGKGAPPASKPKDAPKEPSKPKDSPKERPNLRRSAASGRAQARRPQAGRPCRRERRRFQSLGPPTPPWTPPRGRATPRLRPCRNLRRIPRRPMRRRRLGRNHRRELKRRSCARAPPRARRSVRAEKTRSPMTSRPRRSLRWVICAHASPRRAAPTASTMLARFRRIAAGQGGARGRARGRGARARKAELRSPARSTGRDAALLQERVARGRTSLVSTRSKWPTSSKPKASPW